MSLTATSHADLLASIPHTLGFKPTDSLVVVGLKDNRLGATLRVDLPALQDTGMADYVANLFSEQEHAEGVVVAIYDNEVRPVHWSENTAFLKLKDALDDEGLPISVALLVTNTHFSNLLCTQVCCPPQQVEEITESVMNAAMIFKGSAVAEQAGITVPPAPTEELAEQVMEVLRGVEVHPLNGDPFDVLQPAIASARLEWELALGSEPGLEQAAHLLAPLARKPVRDQLFADAVGSPADPEAFKLALTGRSERVDWERAQKYERLALSLLAYAPTGQLRAELLCLVGFIQWHKGKGSAAGLLFADALEASPEHRLATLLSTMIAQGFLTTVSKSWDTSWQAYESTQR